MAKLFKNEDNVHKAIPAGYAVGACPEGAKFPPGLFVALVVEGTNSVEYAELKFKTFAARKLELAPQPLSARVAAATLFNKAHVEEVGEVISTVKSVTQLCVIPKLNITKFGS